jgi:hypothetical protein
MYGQRIEILEDAFLNETFDDAPPFQIYTSSFAHFQERGFQLVNNMLLCIVWFPHAVTILFGPSLFLLEWFGLFVIHRTSGY